jgi:hypothetical protein
VATGGAGGAGAEEERKRLRIEQQARKIASEEMKKPLEMTWETLSAASLGE